MALFGNATARPTVPPAETARVCLQCGVPAASAAATICRRCGLRLGEPPRSTGQLAACHVCYRTTDEDGRLPSLAHQGRRIDIVEHIGEHERFPVGDDDYLESLRRGDRVRVERWEAPHDVVRRYLVMGVVDGGRTRAMAHSAIVMAMAQVARWGPDAEVFGDLPEWRDARAAVTRLMERYHRGRV